MGQLASQGLGVLAIYFFLLFCVILVDFGAGIFGWTLTFHGLNGESDIR